MNISPALLEEIRIAVAMECGFRYFKCSVTGVYTFGKNRHLHCTTWAQVAGLPVEWEENGNYVSYDAPNYPESLDACAEFEQLLTDEEWKEYVHALFSLTNPWDDCGSFEGIGRAFIQATPLQKCLAFLRTRQPSVAKWREVEV